MVGDQRPKNTSVEIVERLNKEINAALADTKLRAQFAELGHVPMPMTPAEFGKFVAAETEKWGRVVEIGGRQAELKRVGWIFRNSVLSANPSRPV